MGFLHLRIGFGGPIEASFLVDDDTDGGPIAFGIASSTAVAMVLVVTGQSKHKKCSGCILKELSGDHEDQLERSLESGDWL